MPLASYRQEACVGPDGVSIHGRAWSGGAGVWAVKLGGFVYDANRIRNASVSPSIALAVDGSLPTTLDDQRIEATITNYGQLVARWSSSNNYYLAYVIGSSVYLYRFDAGVATFLDVGGWSGAGKLKLEAIGSTIRVLEGSTERCNVTDATYATGQCGIRIVQGNEFFDDIEVFVDSSLLTTLAPTTSAPTSYPGTTLAPTTAAPETSGPTTNAPSTIAPTTAPELTFPESPTTEFSTTLAPTSVAGTTAVGTTPAPTSYPGTTEPPTLDGDLVVVGLSYVQVMDQLVARAWLKNGEGKLRDEFLDLPECKLVLVNESGDRLEFRGLMDGLGLRFVRFVIPQARLYRQHAYLIELTLEVSGGPIIGPKVFPMPVN